MRTGRRRGAGAGVARGRVGPAAGACAAPRSPEERATLAGLLLALGLLAACVPAPDPPPPAAVVPIYDPAAGVLPLPNDLLRDPATGLVDAPVTADLPAATRELHAYLNGERGFSSGFAATVRFSGPIDAATVDATTVLVLDRTTSAEIPGARRTLATDGRALVIHAPDGWPLGHDLAVVLRAGPGGVRAADGTAVLADEIFYLLRQRESLLAADGQARGAHLRHLDPALLARLEATRRRNAPILDELETTGRARRDEVAALWTFTVSDRSGAAYDPLTPRLPFPNDLTLDPATGRPILPAPPPDAPAVVRETLAGLATLDGFATWGPIDLPLDGPVDPATVDEETVLLLDPAGARVPATVLLDAAIGSLVVRPRRPLVPRTTYAVAVTAGVRDPAGRPLYPHPLGALLRGASPLVAPDGTSAVTILDDATAARLEQVRAALDPARARLADLGHPPASLAALFAFTTQTTTRPLVELRAELHARVAADPRADDVTATFESIATARAGGRIPLAVPTTSIAFVASGTFRAPSYLDPLTGRLGPTPRLVHVPFVATFPLVARDRRVVLLGHPLAGWRHHTLLLADALAAKGIASLTIDLPYHGNRSLCRADAECAPGGTCRPDGLCTTPLAADPDDPTGRPLASGAVFFEGAPFRLRDNLRQAALDLVQATLVARARGPGSLAALAEGTVIGWDDEAPARVQLVGVSLGGVVGTLAGTVEPELADGVLTSAAGSFFESLLVSPTVGPTVLEALAARGLTPGTRAFAQAIQTVLWALDPAEPLVYARHAVGEPLPDLASPGTAPMPPRRLFVQIAGADQVLPRPFAELLVDVLAPTPGAVDGPGVLVKSYPAACHAFVLRPDTECERATEGRDDVVRFLLATPVPGSELR